MYLHLPYNNTKYHVIPSYTREYLTFKVFLRLPLKIIVQLYGIKNWCSYYFIHDWLETLKVYISWRNRICFLLKHVRWPESGVWPDRREKIRINQTRLHLRGSVHGCNMDAVFMIRNNWIIKAGTFLRWNDKSRQLDTLGVQLGSQLASNQFARSLK